MRGYRNNVATSQVHTPEQRISRLISNNILSTGQ